MATEQRKNDPRGKPVAEAICVGFFVVCIIAWAWGGELLLGAFYAMADPDPGEAIIIPAAIAVVAFGIGLVGLIIAIPLALISKRLPLWFRAISLLPPAVAALSGVAIYAMMALKD